MTDVPNMIMPPPIKRFLHSGSEKADRKASIVSFGPDLFIERSPYRLLDEGVVAVSPRPMFAQVAGKRHGVFP